MSQRDLIIGKIESLENAVPSARLAVCHPLCMGISETDVLKLNNVGEEFIGMISVLPPTKERRKLFVSVSVINVECETNENSVTLYASKIFLDHYNLQLDVTVYFKTIFALPLEKIVIGVNSNEGYNYMKHQECTTDLLLAVCKNRLLVRSQDTYLASPHSFNMWNKNQLFNTVTLDCYPVAQGLLDVKTNIIMVKTDCKNQLPNNCLQILKQSTNLDDLDTYRLLSYTFHYLSPKMRYKTLVPRNYKVEIIPQLSVNIRNGIEVDGKIYDPSDAVFLSKACMNSRKLLEGSLVKIRLTSSVDSGKFSGSDLLNVPHDVSTGIFFSKGDRFAHIFSLEDWLKEFDNMVKSNVAFISPLLWFNLNNHPSPLLQPTAEISIEPVSSKFKLPYASEVHITMVQSPEINTVVDCDVLRKSYFKIPRVVSAGDVLAVSSRADIKFHEKVEEASHVGWPVVYFKVSMIEPQEPSSCFLVDHNNCSIYQVGAKQSYVPATMDAYYSPFPIHPLWEVPRPAGLDIYVEQLQSIVSPYLKLENTQCQFNPHILLMGSSGCGKSTIVKSLCRCLNMHLYMVNCYDLVGGILGASEARIKSVFERATMYAPCVLLLRNVEAIGKVKDDEDAKTFNLFVESLKKVNDNLEVGPVIVIATGNKSQLQNSELLTIMLHHVNIEVPSETERKCLLKALFSTAQLANNISFSYIAQRTAGFVLGDMTALLSKTLIAAYNRYKQKIRDLTLTWKEEMDVSYAGVFVTQEDIINSLEELQSVHAQSVGAPMIPNVRWEDVGGLADVKQEILDTIQLPLQHPELLKAGLRRSGVLLYGPPGTGKTLLAKAVATECCLNFLSVKGPELINMYVGQSEENVREVFHSARNASPCVIFFDELDSLAPNRGRSGDSGGVMDRVVSQLLAELDGLNKSAEVFVIGATNRPDLLDPALLRPGRFDRLVYVGIPEDSASRVKILKALTRKVPLTEDVSLEEIVNKCPENLSGADFYSLSSNALMNAIGRLVQRLENGEPETDVQLTVSAEDFDIAAKTLVPSVSMEELQRFAEIKRNFTS